MNMCPVLAFTALSFGFAQADDALRSIHQDVANIKAAQATGEQITARLANMPEYGRLQAIDLFAAAERNFRTVERSLACAEADVMAATANATQAGDTADIAALHSALREALGGLYARTQGQQMGPADSLEMRRLLALFKLVDLEIAEWNVQREAFGREAGRLVSLLAKARHRRASVAAVTDRLQYAGFAYATAAKYTGRSTRSSR